MKAYALGLYEKAMPSTLSWREKLKTAKEAGYDYVELSIDDSEEKIGRLDMPKEEAWTKELIEYREMIDSTYGAMYHPWVQIFDRSLQKPEYFPPSGAVMGIYARSDLQRGVHKAPANETVMCTGLNILFSRAEQDILNPAGINLIRRIPGQGIRVWGQGLQAATAVLNM